MKLTSPLSHVDGKSVNKHPLSDDKQKSAVDRNTVLLVYKRNVPLRIIAQNTGLSLDTVYQWVNEIEVGLLENMPIADHPNNRHNRHNLRPLGQYKAILMFVMYKHPQIVCARAQYSQFNARQTLEAANTPGLSPTLSKTVYYEMQQDIEFATLGPCPVNLLDDVEQEHQRQQQAVGYMDQYARESNQSHIQWVSIDEVNITRFLGCQYLWQNQGEADILLLSSTVIVAISAFGVEYFQTRDTFCDSEGLLTFLQSLFQCIATLNKTLSEPYTQINISIEGMSKHRLAVRHFHAKFPTSCFGQEYLYLWVPEYTPMTNPCEYILSELKQYLTNRDIRRQPTLTSSSVLQLTTLFFTQRVIGSNRPESTKAQYTMYFNQCWTFLSLLAAGYGFKASAIHTDTLRIQSVDQRYKVLSPMIQYMGNHDYLVETKHLLKLSEVLAPFRPQLSELSSVNIYDIPFFQEIDAEMLQERLYDHVYAELTENN